MIHYQLRCESEHEFDGWFRDSAAFDAQVAAGLLECPSCGTASVHRALMAPRVARGRVTVDQAGRPEAAVAKTGAVLPDEVRGLLQKLRSAIEDNCENVGSRFAEEARAIHTGERDARPIYGDASSDEAEALADEGIEVHRIPWVPREDA